MSMFYRALYGLASIGTVITLFRVAPVLWPIDPLSTIIVSLSLIILFFSQLGCALTGKAAA